ncbi:phosphotransferase family protein [Ferrovibrio sp.]|uniref:phosphotransferase family protein n=1 Tax=Ferrovibrio sp. TaxID=1917215 RepID=UPI003D0E7CED
MKQIDSRLRFDENALSNWMQENVDGYCGPLTTSQFKGGQSNPTYRLNTPNNTYVLRRRPPGVLQPSAHAVDREFRVISALAAQGFPVARPFAICNDDSVIGTQFFVMGMVDGKVHWDAALPGETSQMRHGMHSAAVKTLAELHRFDPTTIGLQDYGRPGNYFARQIERWSRQYRASETDVKPAMDKLIAFLPISVPTQERNSIVHGDFRLDNIIFHQEKPDVLAVLDWELSTLGDPLADFTYYLMHWNIPADGGSGMFGLDLEFLGIPTIGQTVEAYCELTDRHDVPDLNWYFAYNLFRLSAILQGIAGRMRDGNATSEHAARAVSRAEPLSQLAWQFAVKSGA